MGRLWYCRVLGEEFGPLSFRQLAKLVREGSVTAEDDVRPDFQDGWQSAHSVIGLYRMAFRAGNLDDPEVPVAGSPPSQKANVEKEEDAPAPLTLLGAIARKRQPAAATTSAFETGRVGPPSIVPSDGFGIDLTEQEDLPADDRGAEASESQLSGAIADAMAQAEERSAAKGPRFRLLGRLIRAAVSWIGELGGWEQVFRRGFVVIAAAVAANGTAWALIEWSSLEQSRFPTGAKGPLLPFFPGWGRCSEWEYGLLMGHSMLLAGVIGVLAARWSLSRTE